MEENYQELLLQTNDDFLKDIRIIYEITDEMAKERLEKVLLWYKQQPHLPKIDQNSMFFYRFLSMNKFNVEVTKIKMENYFSVKTALPEFYDVLDPISDEIKNIHDYMQWVIVPKLDSDKKRINIMRLKKTETAHLYDFIGAIKILLLVLDYRLMNDTNLSDLVIYDLSNCQLDYVKKTSPALLKKMSYIIRNCYAERISAVHFINCPPFISGLIAFSKTIVTKKLAERFHFHKTLEDLHKFIPAKYLPKEYGGNEQSCDEIVDNMRKAFESDKLRKWFIELENLKSDESKRLPENQWSVDDMLGIRGTFRKLDVD